MAIYDQEPDQNEIDRQALLQQLARPFPYTPPPAGADLSAGEHTGTKRAAGGALSGAATGAQIGSIVPGIGTGVGALGGAVVGGIKGLIGARHNDTKDEREAFARQLGVNDTTALWQKLDTSLDPQVANELKNRALNRIGRHDTAANEQWMNDVQAALESASQRQSTATQASATPSAAGVNGGIAGQPQPTNSHLEQQTPNYSTVGQYAPQNGSGYDPTKLGQQGMTGKYKLATALSHFDPSKGVTPDVLAALNTLGIGTFSGSGDKLTVGGNVDSSFGRTRNFDVIGGFHDPNHPKSWNYLQLDKGGVMGGPQGAPQAAPGNSGGSSFGAISSLVPTDTSTYNALQQRLMQILGGPQAFEREALLQQLSR